VTEHEAGITPRRKWVVITAATVLELASYWFMVAAFDISRVGVGNAAGPFALGLALVPFVFMILAFGSRHPSAPGAVIRGMTLSLVMGIPIAYINLPMGLVAGYGAGGIFTLRAEPYHRWQIRATAVALAAIYTLATLLIMEDQAVFVGGIVPFLAIGIADHIQESRLGYGPGAR
jgi:hypothetical protein